MNKIEIVALASFFLLLFPQIGLAQSGNIDFPSSAGFTIDLKEWFILEVSTGNEILAPQGNSMTDAVSIVRLEGHPIQIRAIVSVAPGQSVELRVQALGDLVSPQGDTLPVSAIAFRGSGDGFLSGSLNKSQPALIARWVGAGLRQGTVDYYSIDGRAQIGDFTQRIVYSLSAI
jgi:hypothetical protein